MALQHFAPALVRLEHFAADARTALLADRAARQHPSVVLVTVDEEVLARFAGHNYRSPVDRAVMARLIGVLDRAAPRAIGLDFIYDRPIEPAKDTALADAIRSARTRIVLGAADVRANLTPAQRDYQAAFLAATGREAGHLSLTYDRDDTVRYLSRPATGGPFPSSFAELLARDMPPPPEAAARPAILPIAAGDHRNHRIAWLRVDGQPPASTFRTVPALALLDADASGNQALMGALAGLLRDRVVIVGGDFPDLDRHQTPLAAVGAPKLIGAQIHAHMVAQIIDRRAITHLPALMEPPLLLALVLLGYVIGVIWNIERFVYPMGVTMLIAADVAVYMTWRVIPPFTLPLFGWLAGAWFGRNLDLFLRRRQSAVVAT
jgi:adenylate cyclase